MSGPRSTQAWRRAREAVLLEEWRCWICGSGVFVDIPRHPRSKSVDHVLPLHAGGWPLERSNLRLAHYGCNSAKGGRVRRRVVSVEPVPPRSEAW